MSLWFFGYFNKTYLFFICVSIIANYLLSVLMNRGGVWSKKRVRKSLLVLGIFANIAVIFYFKYFNFFIENINGIFSKTFELRNIILQNIIHLMNMHCLYHFFHN